MTSTIQFRSRRSGGRSLFLRGVGVLLALALAGCAGGIGAGVPTLVPTLGIVIPPTHTPLPTNTPEPDTATPQPTASHSATAPPTATMSATPTSTITPGPSPTATRTSTITRIPTRTRPPTLTPTVTRTPTITFTPTPPAPLLNILWPGLLSKVVSPILMETTFTTGGDSNLTIELIGEDGRVISRKVLEIGGNPRRRFWLAPDLPFEIEGAAETARLQLVTFDEFGRIEALSSVDLVLLQIGRNEINPPAITQEPYLIRQPARDDVVSGGLLVVHGLARPLNDSPLLIELVNEQRAVIIQKQVIVPPPTGELSHTPFTVEIPYQVSDLTPVRLTIRQEGSRIPGTVALVSRLITLAP